MDRRQFLSSSIIAGSLLLPGKAWSSSLFLEDYHSFGSSVYEIVGKLSFGSIDRLPSRIRSYTERLTSHMSKDNFKIDIHKVLDGGNHNYMMAYKKKGLLGFVEDRGIILVSESRSGHISHHILNDELVSAINKYADEMEIGLKSAQYHLDKALYTLPEEVISSKEESGRLTEFMYRNKLGTFLIVKEKKNGYVVMVSHE